MATLAIKLLGGFQARTGAVDAILLPGKAQALLAYLATHPGQPQARDKLATLLWPEAQEARHSLRQTLFTLRKALAAVAPPVLQVDDRTVELNGETAAVDVLTFERLVGDGTPSALERASALYQGDLLEGFEPQAAPFEEWLRVERERLREQAVQALARLVAHQNQTNAVEAAIQSAVRLLALEPFDEAVHRTLMRLYVRTGRRGTALRQYQLCVDILRRELGVEPEPETKTLYAEILQRRQPSELPAAEVALTRTYHRRRRRPATSSSRGVGLMPLVGRAAELARLREELEGARRGRGRLVLVLGEAGIGKSRLVEEVEGEALRRGCRVLLGRSYEAERVLPLGPWIDAFRSGQVSSDEEVLSGLEAVWRAELSRLFPEWRQAPVEVAPGAEDYLRLFEALAELIQCLASRRPLVLVVEDLHWADEMSVRLLSFLGHRLEARPVLMVATIREEELGDPSPLRDLLKEPGRTELVRLPLVPLSRESTRELVGALARAGGEAGVEASLDDRIWRLSEGNPFVVVEVVRALQQGTQPLRPEALALPHTVRDVIARRLDRLSTTAQQLAAVAAVIGREFDFALLQRAAGLDAGEVAGAVEELVRRQVLRERGERFDFTHERVREVASRQLLLPRRKLFHAAVARAMEQLYSADLEPHWVALATHFREGEVWDKAITFLHRAGLQAGTRPASMEAASFLEWALESLERLPSSRERTEQAIDIRLDLFFPLYSLKEFQRCQDRLRQAEVLARTLQDQRRLGWVWSHLCRNFCITGDYDPALATGQQALHVAKELHDSRLQLSATLRLGYLHMDLGNYRRASDQFAEVAEGMGGDRVFERFADYTPTLNSVYSRTYRAWCLAELGAFDEALATAHEAMRIAQQADRPHERFASLGVGVVALLRGDARAAVEPLERHLELYQLDNLPAFLALAASPLGRAYVACGRAAEAVNFLERALEKITSWNMMSRYSLVVLALGEAHLRAGRVDSAAEFARRALDHSRRLREQGRQGWALHLLGEIAVGSDPPDADAADRYYREAMTLAAEVGMRPLVAHCHLGLGELYRRTGVHRAGEHLATAAALYREMGMRSWLGRAETQIRTASP